MRQRLERIVQVDAGQRLVQLAVLLAHPLAVDDQQRRAEFGHQPPDLRRREWIDETARCADWTRSVSTALSSKGANCREAGCRCHD